MSESNKERNLKEKIKQALISTEKVISEDFIINDKSYNNENSKKQNFFELEALNSKYDYISARAISDSHALKKKEVDIVVDLAEGQKEFTAWTSDLTEDYIKINADYRS